MSYKTIDREMTALLNNGALRRVDSDELLAEQTKFAGRVVVITGAGSGLGQAYAVHAARNGAKVVIGDVNQAGLDDTLRRIAAARGEASGMLCDVTSWPSQLALFAHAQSAHGRVDIVVANAGIGDTNVAEWQSEDDELKQPETKTLDVDILGVVYTSRIGLHYMRKNKAREGKALILIASYAGFYGSPFTVLYATAKHAVLGLGRALRYVAANDNINCITLCPYFTPTAITAPIANIVNASPQATVADFVCAASYASTSSIDTLRPGTLVFVHPRGVLVGSSDRGGRPGPMELPKL